MVNQSINQPMHQSVVEQNATEYNMQNRNSNQSKSKSSMFKWLLLAIASRQESPCITSAVRGDFASKRSNHLYHDHQPNITTFHFYQLCKREHEHSV